MRTQGSSQYNKYEDQCSERTRCFGFTGSFLDTVADRARGLEFGIGEHALVSVQRKRLQ
jgi:hypothetical protein